MTYEWMLVVKMMSHVQKSGYVWKLEPVELNVGRPGNVPKWFAVFLLGFPPYSMCPPICFLLTSSEGTVELRQ